MKTLFGSVGELEHAMTFHRDRQGVLAGNVANLDTPGFKPLDLTRPAPAAEGQGVLKTTDPRHVQPGGDAGSVEESVFEDPPASTGADGNAVSLEREMAKIDANRVRYATSAELVSRRLALLRYTSSDGGA